MQLVCAGILIAKSDRYSILASQSHDNGEFSRGKKKRKIEMFSMIIVSEFFSMPRSEQKYKPISSVQTSKVQIFRFLLTYF